MTVATYLSPVFGAGAQLFDNKGVILSGGFINTYLAGTTTPTATYIDNTGTTQNATSIPLDGFGRPPNEIWIAAGVPIKIIITDSTLVQIGNAYDNISGVGDPSGTVTPNTEWVASGLTPTFVDATHMTLPGDVRAIFTVGRRIKSTVTAGTAYATVIAVAFSTNTTLTLSNDSTVLDSGLSAVAYGLFNAAFPSVSAIGVKYDATATVPGTPASIAQPVQRLDRSITLTVTTGSEPVYILTPTQPLAAYATNAPLLVQFHQSTVLGDVPTLNVSGLGARNLKIINSAGAKAAAIIVINQISQIVYDGTDLIILPTASNQGRYLRTTLFKASGTWTKGADVGSIVVQAIGGGGGANNFASGCGGGGSGGYSRYRNTSPASTYTVTIGAGGTVVGGNGGNTTFDTLIANGGAGNTGTTAGGLGGATGVGDLALVGGGGGFGGSWSANIYFGPGGAGFFGGAAPGMINNATGTAGATNTGGGASGGTTTGAIGGSGLVIVEEYS
jgi:hypothetical protein